MQIRQKFTLFYFFGKFTRKKNRERKKKWKISPSKLFGMRWENGEKSDESESKNETRKMENDKLSLSFLSVGSVEWLCDGFWPYGGFSIIFVQILNWKDSKFDGQIPWSLNWYGRQGSGRERWYNSS